MKFSKPFYGCRTGQIYPEHFAVGDDCPPELEAAAIETGAVEVGPAAAKLKKGAADEHTDGRTGD